MEGWLQWLVVMQRCVHSPAESSCSAGMMEAYIMCRVSLGTLKQSGMLAVLITCTAGCVLYCHFYVLLAAKWGWWWDFWGQCH